MNGKDLVCQMGYEIEYLSPHGQRWGLTGEFASGVAIVAETIEGLVGSFEDTGVESVAYPGHVVDVRDRQVRPVEGSFAVVVKDPTVWARFRRAWSTREHGQLVLTTPTGRYHLLVRLSAPLPFPSVAPMVGSQFTVEVIGDLGVWTTEVSKKGAGAVVVANPGDVPVWPRVVWSGAGGEVVLPSGAQLTLPPVAGEHSLSLDRRLGGVVTQNGVPDVQVSRKITFVSESVPIGATRTYTIPAGARLHWQIGVLDPWT